MTDLAQAEYDALPESVRMAVSYVEWQWLSEADKGHLLQTLTEPESYDD